MVQYRTVIERVGEPCGPIDWSHETAKDMPTIWHEAEADPASFTFNDRTILRICMYDGWPYWKPRPAIQFIGPLKSAEWSFFNSYGVHSNSIARKFTRDTALAKATDLLERSLRHERWGCSAQDYAAQAVPLLREAGLGELADRLEEDVWGGELGPILAEIMRIREAG